MNSPKRRSFYHCTNCKLISVPPKFFLTPEEEKQRYLQHNNDPGDPNYRSFLSKLVEALKPHLKQNTEGLDYGSGPGPALAMMMEEDGFKVSTYDPFFSPDTEPLSKTYDFITCTETAEHFHSPIQEFHRLNKLIKPGGWLAIMTGLVDRLDTFHDWYYHRDPTHVSFYSETTMKWIAEQLHWEAQFPKTNVIIFHKN